MKIAKIAVLMLVVVSVAQAQQKHATLSEQKACGDQAKKFFNEFEAPKHATKYEFTSHYDSANKVCYIRIDTAAAALKNGEVSISSLVADAFEGRELAYYLWFSEAGKKYWEVKPTMCHVKPINGEKITCESTEEFESLVDKHFGLGE
jgi:hypothetical protein